MGVRAGKMNRVKEKLKELGQQPSERLLTLAMQRYGRGDTLDNSVRLAVNELAQEKLRCGWHPSFAKPRGY